MSAAASTLIPTYCIQYNNLPSQVDDSAKLMIASKTLTPANTNVPPFILNTLEAIASDFVFEIGQQVEVTAYARLTFSVKHGLVFNSYSDERIKKVYMETISSSTAAVTEKDVIPCGFESVKRLTPTAENLAEATSKCLNEKLVFFDLLALNLAQKGIKTPVEIILEVKGRRVVNTCGGLTTATIRFPHMLMDLSKRFANNRESSEMQICIVGPGLRQDEGNAPTCPQFVEINSLFPLANYLLLDNNKDALKQLKHMFQEFQYAAYDPLTLLGHKDKTKQSAPESYQDLFQSMSDNLAKMAINPENESCSEHTAEMLSGKGTPHQFCIKVNPDKIQIREFEIIDSQFKEEDKAQFDVIVATMSILLAFFSKKPTDALTFFQSFKKFLETLKETGSLYMDAVFMNLMHQHYRWEGVNLGIQYLENCLGNKLKIEDIPLSDFMGFSKGITGVIKTQSIYNSKIDGPANISTANVTVITRLPEKVVTTAEERESLEKQLAELAPRKAS